MEANRKNVEGERLKNCSFKPKINSKSRKLSAGRRSANLYCPQTGSSFYDTKS